MTMICKNCCEELHFLPHVCEQYNMPVLLQMKKKDLKIIIDALREYRTAHYKDLNECVEERDYFFKLYSWLLDQYSTC